MGDVKFAVESREEKGKGAARRLRQRGLAPGVVYGHGKAATQIAFDIAGLERLLATSHGGVNTLIDLEGDSSATGRTVIAKELQREAIRGEIIHGDFYEINLKEKIHISVPVHLIGEPVGVEINGGVLDQQLREIDLMCLPNAIPDDITADVTHLDLGDSLHISDLAIPEGVELDMDETLTIATIIVPRGLKEGEGEVAEEAEADTEASSDDEAKDDDKDKEDD